jgi:hypothetical protein
MVGDALFSSCDLPIQMPTALKRDFRQVFLAVGLTNAFARSLMALYVFWGCVLGAETLV